jgi:DNA-binding response OmpR family regulator
MPKKILVIEDDNDILDMMQYILEDEGYHVLPSSKAEPIATIIKNQPDLILLDDRLPEDSGHNLCARIKSHPETTAIPVILVSATNDLKRVAKECNADNYLTKPFDLHELVMLVKKYA